MVLGPLQEDIKTGNSLKQKTNKVTKVTKPEKTTQNKIPDTSKAISSYSSDWILKQDPNAYTIQIVASPSESNLIDFAKKNSLQEQTAYYKKSATDKAWFVLVHGIHSSREDALKSIEQLPDTLKKNKPYPIQIKYLQEVIRQQ